MGRPKQDKTKQPGYAEKIQHLLKLSEFGKNTDSNNLESVIAATEHYFEVCCEDDMPCTPEGLAACLGCVRTTLYKWIDGSVGNKPLEVRHSIKNALNIIGNLTVYDAVTGKLNPVMAIFLLSNNHGYEREASNNNNQLTINVSMTPQQLEDKYSTIIDGDYQEVQEPKLLPPEE